MPVFDPVLQGFGDLGSALMIAPQQARMARIAEQDKADRRRREDAALAQALQFHEADQANKQAERDYRAARDLAEMGERRIDRAQTRSYQDKQLASQDALRKAQEANMQADNARLWAESLGRGAMNLGKVLGAGGSTRAKPADAPKVLDQGTPDTSDDLQWDPSTKSWIPLTLGGALAPKPAAGTPIMMNPGGQQMVATGDGRVAPAGFVANPDPSPGSILSFGVPGAAEFNRSQDESMLAGLPAIEQSNLQRLSPQDREAFLRIMRTGDQRRIAAARQRLAGLGR